MGKSFAASELFRRTLSLPWLGVSTEVNGQPKQISEQGNAIGSPQPQVSSTDREKMQSAHHSHF